jgi:error-prone DNA polymerase
VAGFAEFGFPKSHAAAFGLLAYQTAWLRTYYPAESLCALFNAQPMGFYAPHVLVNDGKRHGVHVLPPNVNRSEANCTLETDEAGDLSVRIGLRYVRGLSEKTAPELAEQRRTGGDFCSLFDFLQRTSAKREAIENLIACGAFDEFGLEQREMLWQLGLLYRPEERDRPAQRQLAMALPTEQDMVRLTPMTEWERMRTDYLILGMSPSYHPMSFLRPGLNEGVIATHMVDSIADGQKIEIAGLVVCRQQPGTAKGFVFMVLEDEFGLVNVIVRPDIYEKQRQVVRGEPFVIARGEIQRRDGITNLMVESFTPLSVGQGLSPPAHNFGHGGHGGRH